jgi:GDP-L-fucose synthase
VRILLTGATGMVGRNLQEQRWRSDDQLLAPTRHELELTDERAARRYLEREQPDIIVNAAGKVGGILANVEDPSGFLLQNVRMGMTLVAAAHEVGVPRLLNLASSCVYPKDRDEPLTEGMILAGPLEPTNEYLSKQHGRAYKTILPCNLYGRWDRFDAPSSHLVAAAIAKLHAAKVRGERSVEVWGDGTVRREFLYAGDLAAFIVDAVRRFDSLPSLLNVGVGLDHSVLDYYQAAAAVIGYEGTFALAPDKPVGMRRKLLDCSAVQQWGWRASTPLTVGLAETYRFFLETVPWQTLHTR